MFHTIMAGGLATGIALQKENKARSKLGLAPIKFPEPVKRKEEKCDSTPYLALGFIAGLFF